MERIIILNKLQEILDKMLVGDLIEGIVMKYLRMIDLLKN